MQSNNSCFIDNLVLIAHELRRPIDIISKSAELVNRAQEKGNLEEGKLCEIMEGIINSCHRMSLLTSQIMSIAQAEKNTAKIIVEQQNFEDFLNAVRQLLTPYETLLNMKITYKIKLTEPCVVCDFKKIEGILLNLISNAVKFSKPAARKVTVKAWDDEDYFYFSVKDWGIGMDDSEVDKIFNEFYRIEDFSTRQTEGCGLGLSIVRNYVNLLGGSISVESKPGLGSEFTVKIPRVFSSKSNPSKIVEATQVYTPFKSTVDEIFADIRRPD